VVVHPPRLSGFGIVLEIPEASSIKTCRLSKSVLMSLIAGRVNGFRSMGLVLANTLRTSVTNERP
jgi:hypothetical protein